MPPCLEVGLRDRHADNPDRHDNRQGVNVEWIGADCYPAASARHEPQCHTIAPSTSRNVVQFELILAKSPGVTRLCRYQR